LLRTMSSLISIMGDLFGGAPDRPPEEQSSITPVNPVEERGRKRTREGSVPPAPPPQQGSTTPTLVLPWRRVLENDGNERPLKKIRGATMAVPVELPQLSPETQYPQLRSDLLRMVPEEVVGHVLSFLSSVKDRYALQCTCRQFRRISNSDGMLVHIQLGGDTETGKNGIVQDLDTPATAALALTPFARAGNLEAVYMLGMIKSYCHQDVERGIFLLKLAAKRGFVRSNYTLGLILRDSLPDEAGRYMNMAASHGYLPALQEILPARELKTKYGEPSAAELRPYLDPICLNRLLGRHYIHSSQLREVNTSHCWNPLCGRWAFKAQVSADGVPLRYRRPLSFTFFRPDGSQAAARFVVPPRRASEARQGRVVAAGQEERVSTSTPGVVVDLRVSRMKMCSRCCRAKYCSKLCQVYDWRSGRHKMECQFL